MCHHISVSRIPPGDGQTATNSSAKLLPPQRLPSRHQLIHQHFRRHGGPILGCARGRCLDRRHYSTIGKSKVMHGSLVAGRAWS